MGTAWQGCSSYPWEDARYFGGLETVKVNIMLRIYANKWHVYAGLAILNPSARIQIDQYAKSATELFRLMLEGKEEELTKRVFEARDKVFKRETNSKTPILLSESVLDQFSLGQPPASPTESTAPPVVGANSHLSIIAMVDCWASLNINPFEHLELAATPIFRLWIGVAENLYRSVPKLTEAIRASVSDVSHRRDDMEFVIAARGWSQCVSFGSFELYRQRFEYTSKFFESRFDEAAKVGSRMIKTILDDAAKREGDAKAKNS
jgi:prephenate dehydrogenase (NADP+)